MSTLYIVCPYCDTVNRILSERLNQQPRCGQCKDRLFTGHPLELTGQNFKPHIARNDVPVVVDFWASWCGQDDGSVLCPSKQLQLNLRYA